MNYQVTGTIEDIIYINEENGFVIAVVETDDDYLDIKGYIPTIKIGQMMKFSGKYINHKIYGRQFEVEHCELVLPKGEESIKKYLASGIIAGIGETYAEKIVNTFGEDTLDILKYAPERLLEINGIGKTKLEKIVESYSDNIELQEVTIFLQKYNVPITYIKRIYNIYGKHTIEFVSENPYRLARDIKGIGFILADEIARKMEISLESPYRLWSGIQYTLRNNVQLGHTYMHKKELIKEASSILHVTEEMILKELDELVLQGDIQIVELSNEECVYLKKYFYAEVNVCQKLIDLNALCEPVDSINIESEIQNISAKYNIELAKEQKEAIKLVMDKGVSVITGGPGTGKTTIIKSIIEIFKKESYKVLLAAPTGRAAKRMTEATGEEASTIHRLLEYSPYEGTQEFGFKKHSEDPLKADVIIIDEISMVDILLMNYLLDAIELGTRLICVGDADQLPSVGAGNVLKDIITEDVISVVTLDKIFRQGKESMIVVNAHRINHGDMPLFNAKDKDFFLLKREYDGVAQTIENLAKTRLPEYYGFDSIEDIQILSPTKKGKIGIDYLNTMLQQSLNPPTKHKTEKEIGTRTFRVCDKVMQIKNNYEIEWKDLSTGEEGKGVFNGDIGRIHDITKKTVDIIYDDKLVSYQFSELDEVTLAYAITVHKSQGSEFDAVIIPISWMPSMLMTRNILYTGITRGKKLVVLVGEEKYIKKMIENQSNDERRSGLKYRFKQFK